MSGAGFRRHMIPATLCHPPAESPNGAGITAIRPESPQRVRKKEHPNDGERVKTAENHSPGLWIGVRTLLCRKPDPGGAFVGRAESSRHDLPNCDPRKQ